MLVFIQNFDKIRFKKIHIIKNKISKHKSDLMWPSITSEVILS